MSLSTVLVDNVAGNVTSSELRTQRKKDDTGMWMIEWTANSAPGTVLIKYQVRLHPKLGGWATLKTVTEAELGTGAGPYYFAEQVPLGLDMRVVISNQDDAANTTTVVIQE